jgi:hypothetical protein
MSSGKRAKSLSVTVAEKRSSRIEDSISRIDPATGRDIDNDGQPDIVVAVDTAGGTRGNWEYPVISLGPIPRLLLKLPPATFDFQTTPGKGFDLDLSRL